MPGKVSFLSRFATKLVEVIGAGIATAVGGYLIAHLSAYWSAPAPTPAAVQVAPNAGVPNASIVSKAAPKGPRAEPAPVASADTHEPRPASARKHAATDTSPAEVKPHDKDDKESVEAQVRAALANVDANRPAPPAPAALPDAPPQKADIPPTPPSAGAPPEPAGDVPGAGPVAEARPAAEIAPQPAPQAPAQADPLATVEIKSRPVADIDATPQAAAQKDAQANVQEDKGLLSALRHIPDMLRPASGAATDDPPRPPLPVGQ